MIGINGEIVTFFVAMITGVIVKLCYCAIGCLREMYKHPMWLINVEDLIFWIAASIYVFVQIYHTSNGSIRWYFALGVVVGVLLARIFIRKIKKVSKKIYDLPKGKMIAKNKKKRYYNKY